MSSGGRKIAKDLVEEAKKRAVLLLICVFGLSYLMSLTSSSVWVNLPAAVALIIFGRYISHDLDVRRKIATQEKLSQLNKSTRTKSIELHKFPLKKPDWRGKVNSPAVEAAIDRFTRHLISEWVTDLWYSRITPDKDVPEELVHILNSALGEISIRARDVNLINLLTRDIINLVCNHLELYRFGHSKLKKQDSRKYNDSHDRQLRLVLAAHNKLHPALFSAEAEHKVLQHLMNGLIQATFRPEDLQCAFFRYTIRELLACAVFRPVLNLANPRVINEKIQNLVLSFANKSEKRVVPSVEASLIVKSPLKPSTDQIPTAGVELVQVRLAPSSAASDVRIMKDLNGVGCRKDHANSSNGKTNEAHNSGGEWAQVLDIISRRKTQVLAPENLESMWAKGRYYKKKEDVIQVAKHSTHVAPVGNGGTSDPATEPSEVLRDRKANLDILTRSSASSYSEDRYSSSNLKVHNGNSISTHHPVTSSQDRTDDMSHEEIETDTESSYQTEEDENSTVTGLDSPGTRVWDNKNKRNDAVSHIHHPLETSDLHLAKKNSKTHVRHPRTMRTLSGRRRPRSSKLKAPVWQEVDRTSFLLGESQDILQETRHNLKTEELSGNPEAEIWGRVNCGGTASSSLSSISTSESCTSSLRLSENSVLADSFLKLRCEVLGANIVKSGSGTFAVYCIAVTDANNNSWSIKRRYRHFEELHKRLKEFPEYTLSLPPKHFLSSGLDVPVVQERCKLLDIYLKMLLQIPTISGSIEVWDFLSVDSQTYMFSDSLSIIHTLSVNLSDKQSQKGLKGQRSVGNMNSQFPSSDEKPSAANERYSQQMDKNHTALDGIGLRKRIMDQNYGKSSHKELNKSNRDNSGSDSVNKDQKEVPSSSNHDKLIEVHSADVLQEKSPIIETSDESTIPIEWVSPNLSVPVLNLVDVVFQLQDGGWIRRQAFWIAKQLLQLGMGDAFDDWLIEKIQLLRKGTVVASAINRIEQILWPDGIFLTKHPNRRPPAPIASPGGQKVDNVENQLTSEQQIEAAQHAKFVYELMIDKAPAALVSLVGRKEYEQCAEDVYYFLQSPVCLKQLAFELLELLLLATFPELDDLVRQCHEDKGRFGVVEK